MADRAYTQAGLRPRWEKGQVRAFPRRGLRLLAVDPRQHRRSPLRGQGVNSVKLFGNDLVALEQAAWRMVEILRTVHGSRTSGLFRIVGQPNLEIHIDRSESARYGITSPMSVCRPSRHRRPRFLGMVEGEKRYRDRTPATEGPP